MKRDQPENSDERWMRVALELARRGRGQVEPNPLVGAVVVAEGAIVGQGYHQKFGGPHAERIALDEAGENARGATLYVTLEPCCHQGKTPPCTDRVIESGVARVVFAMTDPFPQVAGQGEKQLRDAGIRVGSGCLEREATFLNAGYLKRIRTGLPYIHAKWAMTLDGKIATRTGDSQWISSETSRAHANTFRGKVDAIIVGRTTAVVDNPRLTARPAGPRTPTRIVLDSRARLSVEGNLLRTAGEIPTLVATTTAAALADVEQIRSAGAECLIYPANAQGKVPIDQLINDLGQRSMTHVLVEGGGETIGAFLDADLIDAVRVYLAPSLLGGDGARTAVGGLGIARVADRLPLEFLPTVTLDCDLFIEAHRPVTNGRY